MNKISVIIPVYNKEKYIDKCLLSVRQQTYKNLEIIVIDDGSTDNSLNILRKIKSLDDRIILLNGLHKGVGAARNLGLEHVTGEYLIFIDADDYILEDYVENLIENNKYDLVVSGLLKEENNRIDISIVVENNTINNVEIKDYIFNKDVYPICSVVYTKLLKSEIIKHNNISFKEIQFGEDSLFILDYLKYAKEIKFINHLGYVNNIVKNTLSRKKIINLKEKLDILLTEYEIQFLNNNNFDKSWQYMYFRNVKLCLVNEVGDRKSFINIAKNIVGDNNFANIKQKNMISKKDLIIHKLLKFKLYNLIYFMYKLKF